MNKRLHYPLRFSAALAILLVAKVPAGPIDDVDQPEQGDPSAFSDVPADPAAALSNLALLPEANVGAFDLPEGEGNRDTPRQENERPPALQTSFNYPTNGAPSPLFGAQPFTQQLLLFEEFGPTRLDPTTPSGLLVFPAPTTGPAPQQDPVSITRSSPSGPQLDAFLKQPGLTPFPSQFANVVDRNPWQAQIEQFLNRHIGAPAEGRPPGKGWSHQRWNEFYPQTQFKTVQTGARINLGLRDRKQLHNYAVGEFGPGGLYYQTSDIPTTTGTTRGIDTRFHPNMPLQNHNSLWTFDGTFPPKLLMARYGQPILMRHYNALPIDPSANAGFGLHTISTHEHNGHSPAESDGFTSAFFFPGQYYDYRWPLQLAGYDTINTDAHDARAAFPCAPGETLFVNDTSPGLKTCDNGSIKIRGDWRETMSTHWFHDHMLDFTAQNVYKGNAVMMNYYSALDRGNEAMEDGVNLRLPSGSALPWGNRDYDVNLVIADKAWDDNGQLWFNPFNTDGFLGDQILVNWQYQPRLKVRARSYRFRILNGSVSRYLRLAVVREVAGNGGEFPGPSGSGVSYTRVPFHMIANDGNLMEHAIPFDGSMDLDADGDVQNHNAILPTQGIAERFDIIINFAKNGIKVGDKLYFVNLMEHKSGKGPEKNPLSLADVLSEKYKAVIKQTSKGPQWDKGDPAVGKVLQLNVKAYSGQDLAMDPAAYEPAKPGKAEGKVMIPLKLHRDNPADQAILAQARHRTFIFGRSDGTDKVPWTIKTDGGFGYNMDPRRISAAPQLANGPTDGGFSGDGTLEVWKIKNGGNGWNHPVHVHFEEGIVLSRDGKAPPEWEKGARKDVYRIGEGIDSSVDVEMAIHFREFAGTYMEHCHNTQHEDTSMLLRWDIEHPGQFQLMPTPLPGWDGVTYVNSAALPTFRTGDRDEDNQGNNKKPIANPDSAVSSNGQPLIINVLANDTDPDGNLPLKVVSLTQPDSGQGTTSTDGVRVTYTPPAVIPAPFTATFTYNASDAKDAVSENAAAVSVAVTAAVNEELLVSSATVTARSNNRYTWDLAGTTSQGTGNTLTATVSTTGGPLSLGTAILTPTGTGARWRISVTTTGNGPTASPTVTINSSVGGSVTAAIGVR